MKIAVIKYEKILKKKITTYAQSDHRFPPSWPRSSLYVAEHFLRLYWVSIFFEHSVYTYNTYQHADESKITISPFSYYFLLEKWPFSCFGIGHSRRGLNEFRIRPWKPYRIVVLLACKLQKQFSLESFTTIFLDSILNRERCTVPYDE